METLTLLLLGISALIFLAAAFYLRLKRTGIEGTAKLPFLNPRNKRKPGKKR